MKLIHARGCALALVLLLGACAPGQEEEPPDTPTTTATTPTPTPDQAWNTCTNPDDGYTIDYPADWATNDQPIDDVPPCSLFDPDAAQLRVEGTEIPTDIAVVAGVEPVPFREVTGEDPAAQELDRRETTVDGRAAIRRELRSTGEALYPEGLRFTVWAVDLDGVTFTARTFATGEPDYATSQEVLDEMVASVTFLGDVACSAEGTAPDVEPQEDLPAEVAQTRADIAEAAAACDFERLAELAGDEFTYSFGASGDPAGHWRREEASGAEPLRYLIELLDRPHATVVVEGDEQYVWPSAFQYENWQDVPDEDRRALLPLYDEDDFADFERFGGYIGYRVGVAADGTWLFFVAGD